MRNPIITVALDIKMVQRLRQMSLMFETIPDDVAEFINGIEDEILDRPAPDSEVLAWKMKQFGGDMLVFAYDEAAAKNLATLRSDMDRLLPRRA